MIRQEVTQTREEVTRIEQPSPQKVVKTTTRVMPPAVEQESPQKVYKTKKTIFRTYQVIWYILGIIETLLVFRVLLKLIGANPTSGFANFIYSLSNPFALPFSGIVPTSVSGNSLLEWSTLIAIAVYWMLVWGIIEFFQLLKPVDPDEVEQTVDNA